MDIQLFFSPYIVMATNKSKKKHDRKDNIRHEITKKKHRHRRRRHKRLSRKSPWQNNYVYESDNVISNSINNSTKKNNDGNIVNGLRDYLSLKK
jgi:hypothetical protein